MRLFAWGFSQFGRILSAELNAARERIEKLEDTLNHLYHYTSTTTHQRELIDEVGCGSIKETNPTDQ
jgi:hypothetical protein